MKNAENKSALFKGCSRSLLQRLTGAPKGILDELRPITLIGSKRWLCFRLIGTSKVYTVPVFRQYANNNRFARGQKRTLIIGGAI